MTQDTTPGSPEVPSGITEEQATQAILEKMGVRDEPPAEDEPSEEPEQTEGEEPSPDAEEPEEEEPTESDDVEIDVGGEKIKVPAAAAEVARKVEAKVKEIEAGATRKFQEAADQRRVADAQLEQAKQISELSTQEIDLRADLRMVERRLSQIPALFQQARAEQDPVKLTELNAEFNELSLAKGQLDAALKTAQEQKGGKLTEATQARLSYLQDWAKKNIKGFDDTYSQTLLEFSVKELGADPKALVQVLSEPVLKALDLAYKGWKVQQTNPKDKQVVASKTIKPGAAGQVKTNAQEAAKRATNRLRQTGSVDDAAAAILARMNAKRR
jgi:hypothetical protein